MNDTISRQVAIDSIMEEPSEVRYPAFYAEKIRQQPPAQERKKGKWIDQYQDGDWHCSCCGAIVEKEEQTLHNWYFCYHCGAYMRKETEDVH